MLVLKNCPWCGTDVIVNQNAMYIIARFNCCNTSGVTDLFPELFGEINGHPVQAPPAPPSAIVTDTSPGATWYSIEDPF